MERERERGITIKPIRSLSTGVDRHAILLNLITTQVCRFGL